MSIKKEKEEEYTKRIFPKSLNRILRRLQTADIDNPDLEAQMRAEDIYTRLLKERDNKISFFKEKYRKTAKELEQEKQTRINIEAEKRQAEAEKRQAEVEKRQAEVEKRQAEIEKKQADEAKKDS